MLSWFSVTQRDRDTPDTAYATRLGTPLGPDVAPQQIAFPVLPRSMLGFSVSHLDAVILLGDAVRLELTGRDLFG